MKTIPAKKGHAVVEAFMAGRRAFQRGVDIRCHYRDQDKVDAFEHGYRWERERQQKRGKR